MSTDLRSLLDEIVDAEAPHLDELAPTARVAAVRRRARGLRRRRAGRAAAAVVLAAAVLAVVRVPVQRLAEPAAPPTSPTAVLPVAVAERTRVAAIAAEVDGPDAEVVVLPPNADLRVLVRCSAGVDPDIQVDVGVAGYPPASLRGCDAELAAQYVTSQEAFWAPRGLRAGVPAVLSVRAHSLHGEVAGPAFVYVGLYAASAGALPANPPAVPVATGYRSLGTVTLDPADQQAQLVLPLPAARDLWFTASCGGHARGLNFMLHVGRTMLADRSCVAPVTLTELQLAASEVDLSASDVVVLGFLSDNDFAALDEHPPAADARVVITFYTRQP